MSRTVCGNSIYVPTGLQFGVRQKGAQIARPNFVVGATALSSVDRHRIYPNCRQRKVTTWQGEILNQGGGNRKRPCRNSFSRHIECFRHEHPGDSVRGGLRSVTRKPRCRFQDSRHATVNASAETVIGSRAPISCRAFAYAAQRDHFS